MTGSITPRLQLVATAALFSTGGAIIKAIDLSAWQVVAFRSAVAAVAVLLILPQSRRLARPGVWVVGAAFAVTMVLFVWANRLTTAANAIYLQATSPLYVLLLSPWLLKERIQRRDLVFMAALAVGLAMFFLGSDHPSESAPRPVLGNVVASFTGLTWACVVLGLRWLSQDERDGHAAAAIVAGAIVALLATLPLALPVARISASDIGWLLFLGVFQLAVAYAFMIRGMRGVPAFEASLLLLLEPVLNPLWAWLAHDEVPSGWSLAACCVILAATVLKLRMGSPAASSTGRETFAAQQRRSG